MRLGFKSNWTGRAFGAVLIGHMSKIMHCRNPFPLPDRLDARLQPIVSRWEGLKRGENNIPFGDDLGVQSLSKLPGNPFLLSVSASPERCRFEFLSDSLRGAAAPGSFLDEISPNVNFSFLRAQSSATIEAAAPTFLHLTQLSGYGFSRVLLPLWGNGQVNMLLDAIRSLHNNRHRLDVVAALQHPKE
jgi:hypothetical protein